MAPPAFAVPAGPKNIPPHRWRACDAGPYKRKIQACVKFLSLFQNFIVGASIARPPLPYQQTQKYPLAPRAGLQCRPLQAKGKAYAKIQSLFQNFIVGARIARPPKPCGITSPRVEQSPTPTICRERVRLNFIAISQFCRRGGAWLRPPLPCPLAQKYTPAPLRACHAGPYKPKARLMQKFYCSFKISS